MSKRTKLEDDFLRVFQHVAKDSPQPVREYRFHSERMWRMDFAWPEHLTAVEIEGGIWVGGGHNRGGGYAKNCEKYNAATCAGWRVLRYTTKDLKERPVQCAEEVAWLLGVVPKVQLPSTEIFYERALKAAERIKTKRKDAG